VATQIYFLNIKRERKALLSKDQQRMNGVRLSYFLD
jgi:hypothetical protein